LFLHPSDEKESLQKELDAALRAGVNVEMLDHVPGFSEELEGIHFKEQAQFHPMKYLKGLCQAIEQMGGRLFTETHASEIHPWGIVSDQGYKIKSNYVVVATNSPVNGKYIIPLKQIAYRTYVIGALIKKEILPRALWWDTGNHAINSDIPPYHYVRLEKYDDTHDLIICGGEDHPVGDPGEGERASPENRYILLESWARKYFPLEDIIYRWSGQVMEPMDGLAYIGHNPFDKDNIFIVTGDSGNGMTHCTIAGILITDLITGKKNKWQKIYKPSRFIFKASGPFFQMLKGSVMDILKKFSFDKEAEELSSLKIGEGKVVKLFGEKCGAFRDENNYLHLISAECTHLGCTVTWNMDEQSWDCPCHGSRFTYKGKVINGPANNDLPGVSESEALESRIEHTKFVVG
ncbi:MAG: FAD-dependent oxidoreductase, partial [Bacteroidetes bacterium]|nr:FAD-dependent oxidoreductase [Bacteroidota bacterium]